MEGISGRGNRAAKKGLDCTILQILMESAHSALCAVLFHTQGMMLCMIL